MPKDSITWKEKKDHTHNTTHNTYTHTKSVFCTSQGSNRFFMSELGYGKRHRKTLAGVSVLGLSFVSSTLDLRSTRCRGFRLAGHCPADKKRKKEGERKSTQHKIKENTKRKHIKRKERSYLINCSLPFHLPSSLFFSILSEV